MEPLVILNNSEIEDLLKLLESDMPKSIHALNFLKCVVQWRTKNSTIVSRVMAPGGDYSDCTFILCVPIGLKLGDQPGGDSCRRCEFYNYTAYSNSAEGRRRLEDALNGTGLVQWKQPFLYTCLPESIADIIERVLKLKIDEEINSNPGLVYWLPREKAAGMPLSSLPEDVYVDKLKAEDSAKIDGVWPHREQGSLSFIAQMIELNGGLGLYRRSDGQLLSWGLYWFYGGMGVVQTDESQFRKGYGSAIVERLTRYIATEAESGVHLNIVKGNRPSVRMFEKLGFEYAWTSRWISPKVYNMSRDMDPLVDVSGENVSRLLDKLKTDLPQSIHAYYFVDGLQEWRKRLGDSDCEVGRLFAPQGDISDGTFLAYFKFGKFCSLTAYSMTNLGRERLKDAIIKTRRLSCTDVFLWTSLTPQVTRTVHDAIEQAFPKLKWGSSYDHVVWMPAEQASSLSPPSIPDDVYLAELNESHVDEIEEVYPHRNCGSRLMMSRTIALNASLGLFRKEDGRLLSWCMLAFYGGAGVLQTVPDQRRKGYAGLVVRELARRLGSEGRHLHANVVGGNTASLELLTKMGCRPLYTSCWIKTHGA